MAHQPGTFCWVELGTSDAAAARNFYEQLFSWTTAEHPMGEMGTYYIFQKDGKDVAAMYELSADMAGIPPHWLSYVAVASADDSSEKIRSLGGTIVKGPFDVGSMGRMSVCIDTQGAHFAIWQTYSRAGVETRDEENSLCWNELQVRNAAKAKAFYPELFGWRMKESPDYTEWHLGEHAVGGMMVTDEPPEVPSYWLPYFAVAGCDNAVERAKSAGAQVFVPPMDIPNVGRFSVLADPQGAVFAVIKLDLA